MWTTHDRGWSGHVRLSRIGWGQAMPSSPGSGRRQRLGNLSPARQQLIPTVVPNPRPAPAAGPSDLKATRTVIVRSVSPDPEGGGQAGGDMAPDARQLRGIASRVWSP